MQEVWANSFVINRALTKPNRKKRVVKCLPVVIKFASQRHRRQAGARMSWVKVIASQSTEERMSRAAFRRSSASRVPFRASALRLLILDRKVLTAKARIRD